MKRILVSFVELLRFIKDMLTNKCRCGEKATNWTHGIPCCDKCNHEVECLSWLGDECDCGKE